MTKEVMYKPMYDRLYVKRLEEKEEKTASGLILSKENKTSIARGIVIETGCGYRVKYDEVPCSLFVKDGDVVVFQRYAGVDAGDDHIFLKEEEILALEVAQVD